jgi:hypothetical protein
MKLIALLSSYREPGSKGSDEKVIHLIIDRKNIKKR